MQECAQILGIDVVQITGLMDDPQFIEPINPRSREIMHG
jgi:hypothetical protein